LLNIKHQTSNINRIEESMRTTLDIDEDVLTVAKSIAKSQGRTLGAIVSQFARQSLQAEAAAQAVGFSSEDELDIKLLDFGITVFPAKEGVTITNAMVNKIREQEGI
jgi:hypothetical protein